MKTNIKKIVSVVICTAALSAVVQAQVYPVLNVPGPEVGTLGVVHTVPVGHYTGTPNISIPLYDVKVGNFSLPITANYHLAAVKPHTPPTSLGVGWALDAGGYIARTVRGICDERCDNNNNAIGYYAHRQEMQNIDSTAFHNATFNNGHASDGYELSADEFSFSFCGYSGNFYLNPSGGWTVVSDHNIKVEFDENDGFTYLNRILGSSHQSNGNQNTRIVGGWSNYQQCFRFYSKFTLITPDGCRFEFGDINATEYSISYYNRSDSELVPTSWRLSKIITPEGRTIAFTYDTSSIMVNIHYIPKFNYTGISQIGYGGYQTGRKGFDGFLLFPVSLQKIETPNEILDFTLFPNSRYPFMYNDNSQALYWTENNNSGTNTHEPNGNPLLDLLDVGVGPEDNDRTIRNKIAEKLKHLLLHRILIRSKETTYYGSVLRDTIRSIYFDYNDAYAPYLKSITMRPDAPQTGIGYDGRPIMPEADTINRPPSYHFSYNGYLPEHPILAKTDPWGYFTGGHFKLSEVSPSFQSMAASLQTTMKGSLAQIIYPTGARTAFKYEQHDYSKQIGTNHVSPINKIGTSGGLRVAEIIEKDRLNKIVCRKKFHYSDFLNPQYTGQSSGISNGRKVMAVNYQLGNDGYCVNFSTEPFGTPVTNYNMPDVGYSSVIEETMDSEGNRLGHVRYRYSNFDQDIYGEEHLDEPYDHMVMASGQSPTAPFNSHAAERGKLQSKESYDKDGRLVKKETIRYQRTDNNYLPTAYQITISVFNPSAFNLPYEIDYYGAGWMTSTYTYSYLPIEKKEFEYFQPGNRTFTRETFYTYNENKMLAKDSTVTSNGTSMVSTYRYACDTNEYDWMRPLHVLSPLLEKTIKSGGVTQHEKYTYAYRTNAQKKIPYLWKAYSWTGNAPPRIVYEVLSTDTYGNPTEIVEKGVQSTLGWGYNGQKLIRRIINGTLLQYSYTYNRQLQLIGVEEPGKPKLWYDYDYLGRLKEIYYNDNNSGDSYRKTVKRFNYDYRYVVGM